MSGSTTNFQSTLGNNDSQSPLFSGQSYNASDFHIYMLNERARTVPSPNYEHPQSIRIWLIDYEHQAKLHGVSNLDLCARYVATYMPLNIKNWLSRRPPPILAKWNLMKEDLISRFGVSEEVDNKRRLKDLKKCRKDPKQSIRLHATDFEYLLSLITENYTEDTKITMFIQSLDKAETRLSLIALQAALGLTTLDQIIAKAIEVEDRARLQDQPQTQQEEEYVKDTMQGDSGPGTCPT
ncbi:hypothetical protein G6F37_013294 [Rhizopus arrhizus]|nr:hypothetical protein G6F38_013230 [Rhizopus arrhizus]KAG1138638.1 hypothetical protein G6F37_013294 [Rhizopus arrhizus]